MKFEFSSDGPISTDNCTVSVSTHDCPVVDFTDEEFLRACGIKTEGE